MASELGKNLKRGFRGSVSVYLASLVATVSAAATSIILVRGLSTDEFGIYKLAGSIIMVGAALCSLGLEQAVLRYGAELVTRRDRTAIAKLLTLATVLRAVALLTVSLFLVSFSEEIISLLNMPSWAKTLMPIVATIMFVSSMNMLGGSAFHAARLDHAYDSLNRGFVQVLSVLGFGTAIWFGYGLTVVFFVWLGARLVGTLLYAAAHFFWFVRETRDWKPRGPSFWSGGALKRVARYSGFSVAATNLHVFRDFSVDLLLIGYYLTVDDVALYGLAAGLVAFATQYNPASQLRAVFQPLFTIRYTETGDAIELARGVSFLLKLALFAAIPTFGVLIVLADKIITLVYSPDYVEATPALVVLASCYFFYSLAYAVNPLLVALEKPEIFLFTGVAAVYNFGLAVLLIPRLGLMGAAIATGTAGILQLALYLLGVRYYAKVRLTFDWAAAVRMCVNAVPAVLLMVAMRPRIASLVELGFVGLCAVGIFLSLSAVNRVFTEGERGLINQAAGRRVWVF